MTVLALGLLNANLEKIKYNLSEPFSPLMNVRNFS